MVQASSTLNLAVVTLTLAMAVVSSLKASSIKASSDYHDAAPTLVQR